MRFLTTASLVFLACFAVLHLVYPWSVSYGSFEFGWWTTMNAYLIVASIVGIVAAIFSRLINQRALSTMLYGTMHGFLLMAFAVILAIAVGPVGGDIPGTRVRGIFFSEWQFLSFIFCVAIPVSVIEAVLCCFMARKPKY